MLRFTVQILALSVFAMGLVWFAGSGEAVQAPLASTDPVLWADTIHIKVDEGATPDSSQPLNQRDTFLRDVKKLTQTAFNIRNQYMEEVNTEEIIKAGINGMLEDLDRFSVLMERSSYEALMESTHGKYEGLGMQIDARDGRIVIITPIEGTPAYRRGLRAGDVIWSIDSVDTKGMSSSDASSMMRGKAGTSIRLEIKRAGLSDPIEFEIERAVIELKSVNYYGVVPGTTIGYVRLSRFAEETSHELRDAISHLNEQNISGLVFDLRSNGGGLLDQAKETAELFVEQGSEIVYTRGRYADSERHYHSERPPLVPKDKPLIILTDAGTASASEIVAGAIQDWDRGLIVGQPTYGKGLVQQIFPISSDGSMALKLTTAKYYVPSGRCIQREDKQSKHAAGMHGDEEDSTSEAPADSMQISEDEIYYTNGGRIVYGGGGILPDIEIEPEEWQPIEINLERRRLFFDYAIKYVADHPSVSPQIEINEEILADFKKFIKEKEFDYSTPLQAALERLKEEITRESSDDLFSPLVDSLEALVEKEKDTDFQQSSDYIRRTIKREIVSSIAGERGVYEEIILKSDVSIQKAIEILKTPDMYGQLLAKGQKKADL